MPILAAPYTPPPPPVSVDWSGISQMTWTGWDGTEWDLLGRDGGVFVTRDGLRGMGMPPITRYTDQSPALPGSAHRGYRVGERGVFWPVMVYADGGSVEWTLYDRAWWRSLHPGMTGVWRVTSATGETRELTCRLADDSDHQITSDPSMRGWEIYGVHLVAEQPFWLGEAIRRRWSDSESEPFFGGDGGGGYGPPFVIDSGRTLSSARVVNPGDEPAWPVWTVTGPATEVTVGVGDSVVTIEATIAEGEVRVIDTRPDVLAVVDGDGVDCISEVTEAAFAALPPLGAVDLSLEMTGTGSVTAEFRPAYHRAW